MASDISKYTKNNQHWVSSSVRPFAFFVIRLPPALPGSDPSSFGAAASAMPVGQHAGRLTARASLLAA